MVLVDDARAFGAKFMCPNQFKSSRTRRGVGRFVCAYALCSLRSSPASCIELYCTHAHKHTHTLWNFGLRACSLFRRDDGVWARYCKRASPSSTCILHTLLVLLPMRSMRRMHNAQYVDVECALCLFMCVQVYIYIYA